EFRSDPRVIERPRLVWRPIRRGVILTTRPRKSARAYRKVWMAQGSPLAVHMARLAAALDGDFGPDVIVDHAMRYGRPAIAERIDALFAQVCSRLRIAPPYPHMCSAMSATVLGRAFCHLRLMRWDSTRR